MRMIVKLICIFALVGCLTSATEAQFVAYHYPFMYNFNPSNSKALKTAFATRTALVAFTGDSTVRGVDESAVPYNAQYEQAMPMQLAASLNAMGINSGANNWYGVSGTSLNDYVIRDGRVAVSGALETGSNPVQGGSGVEFPSAASTFSFTTLFPVTSCKIIWGDQATAGRSFSYAFDGGSATNLTTSGTSQIVQTTVTGLSETTHTVLFSWVASNIVLYAVDCTDTTGGRKEITMQQMGTSGGTSALLIQNTGAPGSGNLQQLQEFPPDVLFTEGGIVNDWRNSISVAASTANLQAYITALKAAGIQPVFFTPPYDNSTLGNASIQGQYVQEMYTLALANNIPLVDFRLLFLSYSNSVAQGWQNANDAVHPSLGGNIVEGQILSQVVQRMLNQSFLLNRDIGGPANDNTPAFADRQAA